MKNTMDNVVSTRDSVLSLTPSQKLKRKGLQIVSKLAPQWGVKVALHHFTNPRIRSTYKASDLPENARAKELRYRQGFLKSYSWGEGKKIVYIVHGWESHVGRMMSFIEPLVKLGFRVIAFDMPGHGFSSKQKTHLNDFAYTLAKVISHYGEPHGIIAHSFGATATVMLLQQQTIKSLTKLCLIAPMPSIQNHIDIFNAIAGLPESQINKLLNQIHQKFSIASSETEIVKYLSKSEIKGLLIHDENDSLIPFEKSQEVALSWKQASFVKTRTLGHRKILKNPEVVRRVATYFDCLPDVKHTSLYSDFVYW